MIIQKRTYSKHIKKMGYATIFRTQCTFTLIAVKRSNTSLPMSKGWSAGTRVSAVWGLSSLKYCWYLLHSSLWKHKQRNKQRVMTGNRNSVQPIQNCTAIFTLLLKIHDSSANLKIMFWITKHNSIPTLNGC